MKKITLVLKDSMEHLPPVISLCKHLNDLGFTLSVICDSISDALKEDFSARGIRLTLLPRTAKIPTKLGTVYRWLQFRKNAWKAIRENPADIYWIGSADTVLALGNGLLKLPYIIHVHELYDTVPMYLKRLEPYMRSAKKVFVPEETRAHIFRAWYQLKETPVILPNKPYGHPRKRNLPISDPAVAEAIARIPRNAKVILFQGWIGRGRNLEPVVQAIEELGDPWIFAIQAPEESNDYYKNIFERDRIYKIPYMSAPRHLEVTSHADIGFVSYFHDQLNNEFCAPNKIWEYAGFGLPILGNDVEGLIRTVGEYQAGHLLNMDKIDIDEIKRCLQDLQARSDFFRENALKFFDSIDNRKIIFETLSSLSE